MRPVKLTRKDRDMTIGIGERRLLADEAAESRDFGPIVRPIHDSPALPTGRTRSSFLIQDILRERTPSPNRNQASEATPPIQVEPQHESNSLCQNTQQNKSETFPPESERETNSPVPPNFKKPRKARTAFSDYQLQTLEKSFERHKYLSIQDRMELASKLHLTDIQVKTWYQNRRTKWKRQSSTEYDYIEMGPPCYPGLQRLVAHPPWNHYSYATQLTCLSAAVSGGFHEPLCRDATHFIGEAYKRPCLSPQGIIPNSLRPPMVVTPRVFHPTPLRGTHRSPFASTQYSLTPFRNHTHPLDLQQ